MTTIKISKFAKRQTPESKFGYYSGSWSELESLTSNNFDKNKPGYRDGVVLVPVPSIGFFSSLVKLKETDKFHTSYESRQSDEEPALTTTRVGGKKQPANFVDIVLYRSDVLAEDNDRSTDADCEIISINCSLYESTPMHPITMMRNELHLAGGTSATYTKAEYLEAIQFWSQHAMLN